MINAHQLKTSLTKSDIILIMKRLGASNYEDREEILVFPTICHNMDEDDGSMKLYYYCDSHVFHCYTACGENFDIFDLVKKRNNMAGVEESLGQIMNRILAITGKREEFIDAPVENVIDSGLKLLIKPEKKQKVLKVFDDKVLLSLSKIYTPEWINEGISVETQKKYGILFSISRNSIVIPHYNINNELVGIRERALDEEQIRFGKYRPIEIDGQMYNHPLLENLYGLNITKNVVTKRKRIVLFEGEKSVMKMDSLFGTDLNCSAAFCGSQFSMSQFQIIVSKTGAQEIIFALDKEFETTASEKGQKQFNKLNNLCLTYAPFIKTSFIYDDDGLLDLKNSPIDKGRDVFNELYKNRKKPRRVIGV